MRLPIDSRWNVWTLQPLACFRLMQACFPYLRDSKGSVINMGSGSSILPHPMMSGYAMAKEAVRTLSRVGAIEWGRYGIRVNAICPLADLPGATNFDDSTGAYDAVTAQVPLGHWGDAESDIAAVPSTPPAPTPGSSPAPPS